MTAIEIPSKRTVKTNDFTDDQKNCSNKEFRGLLVENFSQRSLDTSFHEDLFHEYEKHKKITSVSIIGHGNGSRAIISCKRSEDMEKAFEYWVPDDPRFVPPRGTIFAKGG